MIVPDLDDFSNTHQRSFRLSRGPRDLWVLFAVIAFGFALIVAPASGPWIMRAGLLVFVFVLLRMIRSVRRLVRAGEWRPSSGGFFHTVAMIGFLAFWVWCIILGLLNGNWIDALLFTALFVQVAYLVWLSRTLDLPC